MMTRSRTRSFTGLGAAAVVLAMTAVDASALSIADLSVALSAKVTAVPGFRPICVSTGDPTKPGGSIQKCVAVTSPEPVQADVGVADLAVAPLITVGPAGTVLECPSLNLRVNVTAVEADATISVKVGDQTLVSKSVGPQTIGDFVAVCQ